MTENRKGEGMRRFEVWVDGRIVWRTWGLHKARERALSVVSAYLFREGRGCMAEVRREGEVSPILTCQSGLC